MKLFLLRHRHHNHYCIRTLYVLFTLCVRYVLSYVKYVTFAKYVLPTYVRASTNLTLLGPKTAHAKTAWERGYNAFWPAPPYANL